MKSVQECIERAQHCERQAAATEDAHDRSALIQLADEWRDLARRATDLEVIDKLFIRQADSSEPVPTKVDRR